MEPTPAGTPAADPAVEPAGLSLPMTDDEAGQWQARIDAAKKAADAKRDEWKHFVSAYMVKAEQGLNGDHRVTVPLEFAYVELKKAQLAFQVPEVNLKPKRPEFAGAVRAHEGAVNHELREAGAFELIDTVLTDVLICGVAAAKVGYYADIRERQVPIMTQPGVDPMSGQPLPETPLLDEMQQPVMKAEPYVAHECYYADRIAPENLLFPPEFTGGDYDKAAWLGHRFQLDLETAKTRYGLPPEFAPTATKPQETLSSDERPDGRDQLVTKDVEGVEIFYQATVYASAPKVKDETGKDVPDPTWQAPYFGQYRRVVFIKGETKPVVHEDDKGQYVDETDGRLKGRTGNAIHPLTLRYLPGSSYPVSDVEAGRPSSEEISTIRSQQINFRERVMPILGIDRTKATAELKKQLELGSDFKIGKVIGVDGNPNEIIQPVSVPQFPRETNTLNDTARGDFDTSWAIGRRQTGESVDSGEPVTAAEINSAEAATDTRLAREQIRVLRWFTKLVEKYAAYLQQFKDEPGYAEIVGADGIKALQAWNRHTIQGEFLYEAKPDAALRLDINQDRQQKVQLYTQLGNDPNVNRAELLKAVVISYGLEPENIVVEQLPEKGPEPPRISWSFKGDDLSPIDQKTGQPNCAFPLVLSIAQQGGIQFPPEAIQNAMLLGKQLMQSMALVPQPAQPGAPQTEHPGATTPMQPISKQVADRTAAGGVNTVQ
jgi:hypothetical protein